MTWRQSKVEDPLLEQLDEAETALGTLRERIEETVIEAMVEEGRRCEALCRQLAAKARGRVRAALVEAADAILHGDLPEPDNGGAEEHCCTPPPGGNEGSDKET